MASFVKVAVISRNDDEINITKNFKKEDANVLHSITFPINEHHDQIKRQMLRFFNINQ